MEDHIVTAAEATAVIVVNSVRMRTSLCIPGATDVRPPAAVGQPSRVRERDAVQDCAAAFARDA
jgi:hypothetical protein